MASSEKACSAASTRLADSKRRLDRVEMTDVVKMGPIARKVVRDWLAGPGNSPRFRRQQARHYAQQARLAAAIGPGQKQRAARWQHTVQLAKDQPLATAAGEPVGDPVAGLGSGAAHCPMLQPKKGGSGGGNPEPRGSRPNESAGCEVWGTNL